MDANYSFLNRGGGRDKDVDWTLFSKKRKKKKRVRKETASIKETCDYFSKAQTTIDLKCPIIYNFSFPSFCFD